MNTVTTIAPEAAATAATAFPGHRAPPATLTIFGAGGDLTKRLVVPALYNLVRAGKLPDDFAIIGVDHGDRTTEEVVPEPDRDDAALHRAIRRPSTSSEPFDDSLVVAYLLACTLSRGDFTQARDLYQPACQETRRGRRPNTATDAANVLFYLAVAERFFGPMIEQLGRAGLTRQSERALAAGHHRKAFRHDLASAERSTRRSSRCCPKTQIYRMDHFLGKETVQNILVLRFANGIFEPLWNRDHIDHVQITVAETVGVERPRAASTRRPARCATWCRTISSSSSP